MGSEIKIGQYLIALSGAYLEMILCIQRISEDKFISIYDEANPLYENTIFSMNEYIDIYLTSPGKRIICDKPEDAFLIAINKSGVKTRYGNCEQT